MNDLNKIIAAAVLLIAGSVAYYFAIAAPGIERDKVALERQKYEDTKAAERQKYEDTKAAAATEKELAEAKESERVSSLLTCRAAVEKQRNNYMEMNGTPVRGKPGIYSLAQSTIKEMARIEKDGTADCDRMYGG